MTEPTKIGDIYNMAIEFFDLKDKNRADPPAKVEDPTNRGSDEHKVDGQLKDRDEIVKEVLRDGEENKEMFTPNNMSKIKEKKHIGFVGIPESKQARGAEDEEDAEYWDTRKFILTDEFHNDLWLLHDVTVNSFFQAEENLKHAVFYLRPKCLTQKALIELQEESLGLKKTQKNASDKRGENDMINELLTKFENKHKNMQTYSLSYYKDPKNEIQNFKSIFSIDFTNFIFNILILIIMVVQLFLYLDNKSALLKQAWASNQKEVRVYTMQQIKADLVQTLNLTITDSK